MTERDYGVVKLHSSEEIGVDCPDCGALVWNEEKHDDFHNKLDAIERVQRSLSDQHV